MKRSLHLFLLLFLASNTSFLYAQTLLLATGSANTFSVTYPANFGAAIPSGTMLTFQSNQSITGIATLNVNGIGAFTIKKNYNQNLLANDIKTGHFVAVIFDGTNWQMLSISGNPGGGIIGGGTASGIAFFTNSSTLTADGTNFTFANGTYTTLKIGKILIRSTSLGGDNLSVGVNSGNNNIAGNSNTMYGELTGNNLSTGNENAFFGTAAGSLNAGGTYNSFFGSGAGYNNASGSSNSIFGSDAGLNSLGNDNVFMGRRAGVTNGTGAKNVIIGSTADVTTASYSNAIAIGYSATVGGNNMMALGGANSFAVKVGIGTGTPANTLDIVGGARIENLSASGAVFATASGDLYVSTSSGASLWTLNGTNIQTVVPGNSIYLTSNLGIGVSTPSSVFHTRVSAISSTAENIATFDVSDGGGSYVQIGNYTSTNSLMEPSIKGNMIGSNNSFVIQGITNNDAAGGPMILIDAKGSGTLATKPIFGISNNGSLKMLMSSNGYVGLGVVTMFTTLEVTGHLTNNSAATFASGSRGITMQYNDAGVGFNQYKNAGNTSYSMAAGRSAEITYDNAADALRFNISNGVAGSGGTAMTLTNRMNLTAAGDLRIGTGLPGAHLDVVGNMQVGTSAGFNINTVGNIISVNGLNAVFPSVQGGANTFLRNDGAGNLTWVVGGVTSPWSISGSNIFYASGNVGIGLATVPGYDLDVASASIIVNDASVHGLIRTNVTGSNWAYAIYGEGYGGNTGRVAGVYGFGISTSTGYGVGVYGVASVSGAGSGVLTGIWGEGSATNTNDNYGIYGRAGGSSTNNYAMSATVTNSTGTSNNYGLYSLVNSVGVNNYGLFVTVAGTATNKYAAIFMGGNIGIGITTPAGGNLVHAQSGSQNTIFAVTSNSASDAAGVRGENASATGDVAGVYGRSVSNSDFAAGVYGKISTAATTGQSFAVYGSHDGNGDYSGAVRGYHSGATGLVYGVQGVLAANSNPLSAAIAGIASGSAGFAGYFDSRLYVATALGIGTTTVGANIQLAIKDGHFRTMQTTAPTIATGAAAGTTPSVSVSNATDVAGKITITSGSGTPTAGIYATVTFNKAYTSTTSIIVIIVPTNLAAASKNVFISSTTATTFVVNFAVAAATSTAHTFNYFVIETQ